MHWVRRDPKRFLHEREELEKLAAEVHWIEAIHWRIELTSVLVEADLDLAVHGNPRPITLTYPDIFPDTPAYIRPRDKSQLWSAHQYGEGGSFCLEWRADNWQRDVTGADLVRSVYKLLSTESHPDRSARVPSAHHVTLGQELRSENNRLIATPGLVAALSRLAPGTVTPIRTNTLLHKATFVCFVREIGEETGAFTQVKDLPEGLTELPFFAWKREGFVVKDERFSQKLPVDTVAALQALICDVNPSAPVTLPGENGSAKLKDAVFLLCSDGADTLQAFYVIDGELTKYVVLKSGAGIEARLPAGYAGLGDLRIAIIGLGSMGSKIAVSLARSGCRKFLAVDDDIFLPENICRNELSWTAVGVHKAAAIAETLSTIAADIEVDVRVHRLAGQESSMWAARVLKSLPSCDLIIDATANPDVFLRLASLAQGNQVPICWGEVFAGGIGGLIARARPGSDPNPLAVRNGILRTLEDLPPAPYRNATRYDVLDEEPVIADDADVGHIASAIARLALDTLVKREPTSFPSQAYLIGLRNEWVFSSAFDTRPIDITGEGWDLPQSSKQENKAAMEALVQMITEGADDSADSAAGDPQNDQSSVA